MNIKDTIQSLLNLFFATTSGNDTYCLRYHYLTLIFELMRDKKLETYLDINEDDLYNLQFNYEHFGNSGNVNALRMKDYEDNIMKADELEVRLQVILNKMFVCLKEVLEDYGFNDLGFK